jgi:hypothetical protein
LGFSIVAFQLKDCIGEVVSRVRITGRRPHHPNYSRATFSGVQNNTITIEHFAHRVLLAEAGSRQEYENEQEK